MTKEEKQLLLKDLSMRLPYGVICNLFDIEDADTYEEACEEAIKYCLENLI